jgi:hypothetical protein
MRSMRNINLRFVAIVAAIVGAAVLRLVPHPPNFAPIGAMALFSGAYLRGRWTSFAVPLGSLFLGDALIGFYPHMEVVYASFALIVLLGSLTLRQISALRVGTAAAAGSILFYLITNFGVWLYLGTYPRTLKGLIACYVAAIPYFRNTLAGDLFYSTLLFGGFALLQKAIPAVRRPMRPERLSSVG